MCIRDRISTFHLGSDFKYLYEMLEEETYIALGGMAAPGTSSQSKMAWLDRVWHQLLKRKPDIKVHGFGCTGIREMRSYPWESVDSPSWLAPVIFGRPIEGIQGKDIIYEHICRTGESPASPSERNRILLRESIKEFLKIEASINARHEVSGFERASQLDMFDDGGV